MVEEALLKYNGLVGQPDRLSVSTLCDGVSQRELTGAIEEQLKAKLFACKALSAEHKVILRGLQVRQSSSWLQAIPFEHSEYVIPDRGFDLLVRHRLGIPLTKVKVPLCTACKVPCDRFGYHALVCKRGSGVVARHNKVRNCLFDILRMCNYEVRK